MTHSPNNTRDWAMQRGDSLNEHAAELLILLELDQMTKKKLSIAPPVRVLDELQQLAIDQFAAYQRGIGKLADA